MTDVSLCRSYCQLEKARQTYGIAPHCRSPSEDAKSTSQLSYTFCKQSFQMSVSLQLTASQPFPRLSSGLLQSLYQTQGYRNLSAIVDSWREHSISNEPQLIPHFTEANLRVKIRIVSPASLYLLTRRPLHSYATCSFSFHSSLLTIFNAVVIKGTGQADTAPLALSPSSTIIDFLSPTFSLGHIMIPPRRNRGLVHIDLQSDYEIQVLRSTALPHLPNAALETSIHTSIKESHNGVSQSNDYL